MLDSIYGPGRRKLASVKLKEEEMLRIPVGPGEEILRYYIYLSIDLRITEILEIETEYPDVRFIPDGDNDITWAVEAVSQEAIGE